MASETIICRLCGRPMRPTMRTLAGPDGYRCVDFCRGIYPSESIAVQRSMVAHAAEHGWHLRGFTDPDSGQPLTLGELFDRHAVCLAVVEEFLP